MSHYEVIKHVHYKNVLTGNTASIYGAVPWVSENEKLAWTTVEEGWTVRNPYTGQVGIGRAPCKTFAEACELALKLGRPSAIGMGD